MERKQPGKVVIAGGGIAGLEALMAVRDLAGDLAEITLAAPQPEFVYRPWLVEEPFSAQPAERRALAPLAEQFGATFVQQPLGRMRTGERVAELGDGSELPYDAAIVCIGARSLPPFEGVGTLTLGPEPLPINELLRAAAEHPSGRLALIVPPGVSWALPIYEVAMLAERRARELGLEVELAVLTPESAPLIVFGRIPSDAVASLLAGRGIEVRTSVRATGFSDGEVEMRPGEPLAAGAALALPVLTGPDVEGLPADEGGFIPIDEHARVQDADGVYAAGDGTNFPIKQGGIGTQEADAAAEHVAAALGAEIEPQPFHPILRGKLLVGEESINLSADVAGGGGEGTASEDYLWWPPQKVGGRYLAPFLEGEEAHRGLEPPRHPMDVEVALPKEWHREPMSIDPYGPGERP